MTTIAKLVVTMGLNAASLVTDVDRTSRKTRRAIAKLDKQINQAGKRIGVGLGAGLALAINEAVKFEKAMAEVGTLLDDTSGLDATADAVKRLSVEFGQAPVQQAKALYQIISAGASDAATQTELLTAANRLAVGGITDVETAADGLTSVFNAYAADGLSAAEISDTLFATMRAGKTTISELSENIGSVATIASQTGVKFEELGAGIATITASGLSTAQAADGLRGVLSAILKQSDKTKNAAKDLGIQFDVNRLQAVGLKGVLDDIADSGATESQLSALIGRVEGLTAFMAAAREGGDAFSNNLGNIADSAGETEKAVAKMADTTAFKVAQARSAFQVLAIEVGDNFLAAISDAATGAVSNIDSIIIWINRLVGSFKILGAFGKAVGATLVSVAHGILIAFKTTIDAIGKGISGALQAGIEAASGRYGAAAQTIVQQTQSIQEGFKKAGDDIHRAGGFIGEAFLNLQSTADGVVKDLNALEAELGKNAEGMSALDEAMRVGERKVAAYRKSVELAWKSLEDFEKTQRKTGRSVQSLSDAVNASKPRLAAVSALWKEIEEALDAAIKEQTRYEQSLSDIEDAFNPIGKLVEEFEQQLNDLNRAYDAGKFTAEEYQARLNFLSSELGRAANASRETADQIVSDSDRMREATLEGVRQMTSAFGDMWTNIISGAENSFDGIQDAFAGMMSNLLRSATTDKIQLQFEGAFGEGGGGFGSLDYGELGASFGAIAAAEFSDDIIQGLFGDSSTEDYVEIGKQIGTVVGAVIGSIIPVIGTALGAALGAIAGSIDGLIFGKIFGRKFFGDIGGGVVGRQENPRDDAQAFRTVLGEIVGIQGRGGFGDFNDAETPAGAVKEAIEIFDQAIFDALSAAGATDELDSIVSDLETWRVQVADTGTAIEDIIGSRFDTVMQSFGDELQAFVSDAEGLEEQITRLGIGLTAQKFFDGASELFGSSTLGQFFNVLEDINGEFGELGETFQVVAQQLLEIGGLTRFLTDFSASDIESEFESLVAAQNRSVGEALADVNQQLMDAVTNFDGSIGGLQQIAGLVATVREGEIRYLQQLDSLQKGLNANLDDLRNEILGLTAEPQSVGEILADADALIAQVLSATSAEDIAALEQQFSAIIRSINPDDATLAQSDILNLIDSFQAAANQQIDQLRENAIDNADTMRDMVGSFIDEIGSPLDILVASNERIADAVESSIGVEQSEPVVSDPVIVTTTEFSASGANDSFDDDNSQEVLSEGIANMVDAVEDIGPVVAGALEQALGNVNVTVVIQEPSLVNQ